jgi:alpha/beta superfamily hydrolase
VKEGRGGGEWGRGVGEGHDLQVVVQLLVALESDLESKKGGRALGGGAWNGLVASGSGGGNQRQNR